MHLCAVGLQHCTSAASKIVFRLCPAAPTGALTVQAKWAQEGLPSDALSIDNGAIISAAARWPLMIDPQLQGMKWVVGKEMPHGLIILQQSQPKYIDKVCRHFLVMLNFWQRFFHYEVYYGNVKGQLEGTFMVCVMMQVVNCIGVGLPLLIENLPEDIDIVLDNVIGKKTITRGRATLVRIGDSEIELHPKFRCALLKTR